MIKGDMSIGWGEISLPDLLAVEKEVAAAHTTLADHTGEGNDFLGWVTLPEDYDKEEFARIKKAAEKINAVATKRNRN